VAIKILPDEFSRDADRVSRFQREAEVLASLNHPNIAAIYDLQEANGSRYLVLELVEGETLADRIARGPIPVEEALDIAKNICEALEAAHEKGIIHRDLKPANVKITPEGKVKVLDFGLAKAMSGTATATTLSNSPTLVSGTMGGVIIGTAGYMSPEQARGHEADQRSDIFSFGCVLYEMLTGHQAFQGEEVSDVLAAVLAREPDFSLLLKDLNPKFLDLLRRSLEKNRKRRWHCVGDLRSELEFITATPKIAPVVEQPIAQRSPVWKRAIPLLVAVAMTAAITGAALWSLKPSPLPNVTRFSITLGEGQQFTATARLAVAISPDGTQIVYEANRRLYHRWLSEFEARPIPGSENFQSALNPVFSPDGRSVAFLAAQDVTIKKIPVSGGAAVTISPIVPPYAISWGADGILLTGKEGIMRVSANGGKPELVVGSKAGEVLSNPQMLPDRDAVLFTLSSAGMQTTDNSSRIVVQTIRSGERKTVVERGTDARYVPTGHIVYAFGGILFAVPFDLKRLEATGGEVPVVEGVRRATYGAAPHFSFSKTGSLIYVPGPISAAGNQQLLAVIDRKGDVETLKAPPRHYNFIRVSPDGKRVAFESDANIWIYDLAGTIAPRQLTVGGANYYPVWTADGERVTFQSNREGDLGIFWQRADGADPAERLTKPEQGAAHIPDSWSPDGQNLSFSAVKGDDAAVWILSIKEKKASIFAQAASASLRWSSFSPDGAWLAYQSNEMKRNQVWVQPFPNTTGAKYPIVDGGQPFWSPDGKELFFNPAPGTISVVSIRTKPSFAFGPAAVAEKGLGMGSPEGPRYLDITRDGRFIAAVNADQNQAGGLSAPQIQVVLNWFSELQQRVSVK
jgi:serine/threonine-protein kinase